MPLNVAVQMDPIERINIRGDSTFALLLEAQKRGHRLSYYTPDKLAQRGDKVFATVQPLEVRDQAGAPFHPRRGQADRTDRIRRDPAAAGSAFRSRLHHDHASARARAPEDTGRERSRACAQRAGKDFRSGILRPDAADSGHARPRRDQVIPRGAWRHRHEAALRQWRRGGVPADQGRPEFRLALRPVLRRPSASNGWCRNFCPR